MVAPIITATGGLTAQMPTYVYRCRDCEVRSEVFQKITDDPLTTCESCGGSMARVLQPVGIVFKGSGFYTTDYKRSENSSPSAAPTNGKSADSADGKSEAPKTESTTPKPEKKEPAGAAASS